MGSVPWLREHRRCVSLPVSALMRVSRFISVKYFQRLTSVTECPNTVVTTTRASFLVTFPACPKLSPGFKKSTSYRTQPGKPLGSWLPQPLWNGTKLSCTAGIRAKECATEGVFRGESFSGTQEALVPENCERQQGGRRKEGGLPPSQAAPG